MPLYARIRIAAFALLFVAAAKPIAAQPPWRWAHLAGDLKTRAYDSAPVAEHGPSADADANVWIAGGDLWILQNIRSGSTTALWRWSANASAWKLATERTQAAERFVPPPPPPTIDATPHAELHHSDEYERAEREAAQRALEERAKEAAAKKSSRTGSPRDSDIDTAMRIAGEDDYEPLEGAQASPALPEEDDNENPMPALLPQRTPSPPTRMREAGLPEARVSAATTSDPAGGRLFMYGGRGGLSAKRGDSLWMYETGTGTWFHLSGDDIDYSAPLCTVTGRHAAQVKGPCVVTAGPGSDAIAFMNGAVYVALQERSAGGVYRVAIWRYVVDGERGWDYLGKAGKDAGPASTTYAVDIELYAYSGALYIYRPLLSIGTGVGVTGEIWRFNVAKSVWSLFASPSIPLENSASWMVDGLLVTHMPGGVLDGVDAARIAPTVAGYENPSETERMIVLNLESGQVVAVERKLVNGMKTKASGLGIFADVNAPGRRFSGVRTGGTVVGDGKLYMFGGGIVNKRNPDKRNDLWLCDLDVAMLRSRAGFSA